VLGLADTGRVDLDLVRVRIGEVDVCAVRLVDDGEPAAWKLQLGEPLA